MKTIFQLLSFFVILTSAVSQATILSDITDYLETSCGIIDPKAEYHTDKVDVDEDYDYITYALLYRGQDVGAYTVYRPNDWQDDLEEQVDILESQCPVKKDLFCKNGHEQSIGLIKPMLIESNQYQSFLSDIKAVADIVVVDGEEFVVDKQNGKPVLKAVFEKYVEKYVRLDLLVMGDNEVTYNYKSDSNSYEVLVDYDGRNCNFADAIVESK